MSLDALTKKANGLMAHIYSHLYGLPATGLRFFTVYGPWGRPDMAPMLFARAILAGEPIQVFNQGRMQRDFTSIDDIVEGVVRYPMTTTATPLIQSGATKGGQLTHRRRRHHGPGGLGGLQTHHADRDRNGVVRGLVPGVFRRLSPRKAPGQAER